MLLASQNHNKTLHVLAPEVISKLVASYIKGLFIWGKLDRLSGLAYLGEVIFIPRSYGIFHLPLILKFVKSLEKYCFH